MSGPSNNPEAAWVEHNVSQLLYFRSLSLRAKLEAIEGMAAVVRRLQKMALQENVWVKVAHFLLKTEEACRSGPSGADIPRHVIHTHDVG